MSDVATWVASGAAAGTLLLGAITWIGGNRDRDKSLWKAALEREEDKHRTEINDLRAAFQAQLSDQRSAHQHELTGVRAIMEITINELTGCRAENSRLEGQVDHEKARTENEKTRAERFEIEMDRLKSEKEKREKG
jgi:hypothetical protein